jgi:hypothetical protein
MSAPARESKTRSPTLACHRLNVAFRELPSNTALTAATARAKRESPTSCALPPPVFPLAQLGGTFLSLRFEPLLLARGGQTYTTSEWLRCASRALLNLLRTTRRNLVILRSS